jgi:hypothetical protein
VPQPSLTTAAGGVLPEEDLLVEARRADERVAAHEQVAALIAAAPDRQVLRGTPRAHLRRRVRKRGALDEAQMRVGVEQRHRLGEPGERRRAVAVGVGEYLAARHPRGHVSQPTDASGLHHHPHRDRGAGRTLAAGLGGAVARLVVEHEHLVARVLEGQQRVEAAQHLLAPVLDRHGHRHERARLYAHTFQGA